MVVINKISQKRLFQGVYICMRCNSKLRSSPLRVKAGKVRCRKCGYSGLRPKNKVLKAKS